MKKLLIVVCTLPFMFIGCTEYSLKVLPEVETKDVVFAPIGARIEYDGNKLYLPSVFKEDNLSDIKISYSYSVKYVNGSTELDVLNLFNPLLIVGFPLSEEAVLVEGKLILMDSNINKTFTSSCIATKTRSLYQNGGSSNSRKGCLLAVRDNLSSQVIKFKSGEKE